MKAQVKVHVSFVVRYITQRKILCDVQLKGLYLKCLPELFVYLITVLCLINFEVLLQFIYVLRVLLPLNVL